MNNTKSIEITGVNESIAHCEAKGLGKCFLAYAELGAEDIMAIGFNPNSGYTYIALENSISICSMLGRDVEYLITDFENGDESFFDDYEEAQKALEAVNNN